ncbi:MAG TPA: hypothetical protein VHM19_07615, partial [Polyangiales bacterium]|nr:hypothetical protein [Polyangiales bacterium]
SRLVASMGEPFTWGWDPSELGAWLARHGYELVANRSMSELSREHLPARFQVKLDRLGRRVALARIA